MQCHELDSCSAGDLWPHRIPNVEAALRRELETGLELQQQGKLAEAEAIFGRAIALHPESAESWHALGLARYQQNDFQGAVDSISRAILIDASQAHFFNNYGAALQGIGRCPDAIAAYRAALHLRADYYDAVINLVRALNQQLQWKSALLLAKESIERWPSRAELLRQGSLAAENFGRFDLALEWLDVVAAQVRAKAFHVSAADYAEMLRKIGYWLVNKSRPQEAVRYLEESLALEPRSPESVHQLARAYSAVEDFEKFRAALQQGRKVAPADPLWPLIELTQAPPVFESNGHLEEYRRLLENALDGMLAEDKVIPRDQLFRANFIPP